MATLLKKGLIENPARKHEGLINRLGRKSFQKRLDRKPEKRLVLRTLSPNPIGVITSLFKKGLIENSRNVWF
jgi:hypothetical protein